VSNGGVATELNALVLQRVELTPELMILRVAPDGWELPRFEPGQFAVLGLPGSAPRHPLADPEDPPAPPERLIRRAYSIASPPGERDHLEFYITLVRSGALTPRLWALEPGRALWLGPRIAGVFTLDRVPDEMNVVLVATGTGLAPYMSMLRADLLAHRHRRVAVLHGARHSWDLGYRAELATLDRLMDHFAYVPTISRPDEEPVPWGGETGYVQELWRRGVLEDRWGFRPTPADTHVLLCGNPAMIEDAVRILAREGFVEHTAERPGQVHVERYW